LVQHFCIKPQVIGQLPAEIAEQFDALQEASSTNRLSRISGQSSVSQFLPVYAGRPIN